MHHQTQVFLCKKKKSKKHKCITVTLEENHLIYSFRSILNGIFPLFKDLIILTFNVAFVREHTLSRTKSHNNLQSVKLCFLNVDKLEKLGEQEIKNKPTKDSQRLSSMFIM